MNASVPMITFIASKVITSSRLSLLASPSIAFLEIFMDISKIGITTGKERTAINMPLFSALEAMPDISVKEVEKPTAAKRIANKNKCWSCIGFPNTRLNIEYPNPDNKTKKQTL